MANSACQAASLSGGMTPEIGFQVAMERPEPVMRVKPPTTRVAMTMRATQ